jgi:hypothetical protein
LTAVRENIKYNQRFNYFIFHKNLFLDTAMASIQGIYLALFGRPADPQGLLYFNTVTSGGADLSAIGDLAGTPEYQARFVGMDAPQIINAIYQSLFARDAEPEGLSFWSQQLASGSIGVNSLAIAIFDGARGSDFAVLQNKVEAANRFTTAIDAPEEIAAYSGAAAIALAQKFLAQVTTDPSSVPTLGAVDAFLAALG